MAMHVHVKQCNTIDNMHSFTLIKEETFATLNSTKIFCLTSDMSALHTI